MPTLAVSQLYRSQIVLLVLVAILNLYWHMVVKPDEVKKRNVLVKLSSYRREDVNIVFSKMMEVKI